MQDTTKQSHPSGALADGYHEVLDWRVTDKPVRVIVPKEGVAYVRLDVGMLKGTTRPNAAKLFMNYYISEELQTVVGSMGLIPVVKGVAEKIPADKRVMEGAKLMGTIKVETQVQYLKLSGEIYK